MVTSIRYSYYVRGALAWYDRGEEGAAIGQDGRNIKPIESKLVKARARHKPERDQIEYLAVEIAVGRFANTCDEAYHSGGAWIFETVAARKQALEIAKEARKNAMRDQPWPEWALRAKAAGWKPSKGWTP